MKIATWNLQRLEKKKNQNILDKLYEIDADILVLTETNSNIQPENYTCLSTDKLPIYFDGISYNHGENRTSILSKYPIKTTHATYDSYTSVCADIVTPFGELTVYSTIIGVFANKQPRFDNDLYGQLADFDAIFPNKQICLIGDLNIMFSGFAYPSHRARNILNEAFQKFNLMNLTAEIANNVDHIILSTEYIKHKKVKIDIWNTDKTLSDHIGLCVTLSNEK